MNASSDILTVQDVKVKFEAISKTAALEILLPLSNDLDIHAALQGQTVDAVLKSSSRLNVYFDERTSLFVLLKTNATQDQVREALPHLDLTLSAHAADSGVRESGNVSTAKYDLVSRTISATTDLNTVVTQEDITVFVWKIDLHLSKPRARFQRPAIYFMVNLSVNTKLLKASKTGDEDILKSFEPVPANVLAPLHFDPALSKSDIQLSEDRVIKVAPSSRKIESITPIRGSSQRMHPAAPALLTRIRYSALPDSIVVSLHVDTSISLKGTARIDHVQLSIAHATVTPMFPSTFGTTTKPAEELVYLYKVKPNSSGQALSVLTVDVKAYVNSNDGSTSDLHIHWQAQIDLSQTAAKPTYRWSKATNTPSHKSRLSSQIVNYQPVTETDPTERTSNSVDGGIIFTFTAPEKVQNLQGFKVDIQCINRSGRARRFSLTAVPYAKPRSRNPGLPSLPEIEPDPLMRILHTTLDSPEKPAQVLDLDPDVKIGPLPAHACFETSMRFRPVTTGVLDIGTIRIMDLDSMEIVDVRDISQIISLEDNG